MRVPVNYWFRGELARYARHILSRRELARAELQEALPILARRLPNLRLDGPVEWKPPTTAIWGPSRLPIAWGQ